MSTRLQRHDHGRAARAADLIAALDEQLPLAVGKTHPARVTLRELQQLFIPDPDRHADVRELLERVPGDSLSKKGERIGISKGSVWALWRGKYRPNAKVMARIVAAAKETLDAQ